MRKLDRAPQTLGEKLRALRRGQAVTLEMLVERTQIQKKYLHALERGEYGKLPEPIYTRQFVRMYTTVLGADTKYFLELYDEECGSCDLVAPLQAPRKRVQRHRLIAWNRTVAYVAVGLAIAAFFIYMITQVVGVFTPPTLQVLHPEELNSVTDNPTVLVDGYVDEGATVLVNGDTVPANEELYFMYEVPLQRGVNTIEIQAVRRYSAKAKEIRTIVYDDSSTGE